MTPLVCVHGFMGGSAQWALQEPLREGRQMVCLDLPGFGLKADRAPLNRIDAFADHALAELDAQSVDSFDLMGHSMGGMIVQEMARRAPERVRRLVLYATGPQGLLPGRFEPIETSMRRAQDDGPEATARRIAATWFLHGENALAYRACADIAARAGLPAILAGLEAMRDWSGRDHLDKIGMPTLILWGDADRTYAWPQIEALWRGIPDSHLAVVPQAAHAVHLERAGLFNRIVGDFLA